MAIYSALRHRATVRRSTRSFEDGRAAFSWHVVAENVPVLVDAVKASEDEPTEFQRTDRKGVLLAGPRSTIQPGDRITMTRGGSGTYLVHGDPAERPDFHGLSHVEHAIEQVA